MLAEQRDTEMGGPATLRQRGLERVPEHPLDALQALVEMDSAVWAAR